MIAIVATFEEKEHPRHPSGRFRRKPNIPGINLPEPTPGASKLSRHYSLETQRVRPETVEYLGGGISGTYTAELADGTKVVIKPRVGKDTEANQRIYNGPEHSAAAVLIADRLEVDTPRAVVRDNLRGLELPDATDKDGPEARSIGDDEDVSIQEFVEGFKDAAQGDPIPVDRELAEKITILDYLISNTDRHDGNWGVAPDGTILVVDQDMSFGPPLGRRPVGQYLHFTEENGKPLSGQPLSEDMFRKLEEFERDEEGVRSALKRDGLTDEEIDGFFERLDNLLTSQNDPNLTTEQNYQIKDTTELFDREPHPWPHDFVDTHMTGDEFDEISPGVKVFDIGTPESQMHLRDLEKVPEETRQRLVDAGVTWMIGKRASVDFPGFDNIRNEKPSGWSKGSTWGNKNVPGLYRGSSKTVIAGNVGSHGCDSIMLHETGHAVHLALIHQDSELELELRKIHQRSYRAHPLSPYERQGSKSDYPYPYYQGMKEFFAIAYDRKHSGLPPGSEYAEVYDFIDKIEGTKKEATE